MRETWLLLVTPEECFHIFYREINYTLVYLWLEATRCDLAEHSNKPSHNLIAVFKLYT